MTLSPTVRIGRLCASLRAPPVPPSPADGSTCSAAAVPSVYPVNRPSPDRLVYISGDLVPLAVGRTVILLTTRLHL